MPAKRSSPPVTLTIAGSDNSCGAGIQTDLKTIHALGGYAQTAITCVVAEVPGAVEAIAAMPPELVADQIRLSCRAFPVKAAKTGMLFSAAIIRRVAAELAKLPRPLPLVVDPVMVASGGEPLLEPAAVKAYREHLFPLATLVTPNLDELRILSGEACESLEAMEAAGRRLVTRHGCAFLLKGGHLRGPQASDILVTRRGCRRFTAAFVEGIDAHGTGCSFSAGIAAGLAAGLSLARAVGQAKEFLTAAIRDHHRWHQTTALAHAAGGRR
jgi:hydroxymethylpyrimidine/phosphomethylpyrimidine kinase